ncbi:hypothetical protein LPJ57_006789, partial [Coemansia sp. RSA 486]
MKFTVSTFALCAVLASAAVKAQTIDNGIGNALAIVNEKAGSKDIGSSANATTENGSANTEDDAKPDGNGNGDSGKGNGRDTEDNGSSSVADD